MNLVVVFGGKSVEHEISIISAFQVIEALKIKYKVIPVYISKDNKFYYDKNMQDIQFFKNNKKICKRKNLVKFKVKNGKFYVCGKRKMYFDMIFPIVHGKGSEDGSILNYFRFMGFPIVGNNACFYSLCQDKTLTKRVLDGLGIDNVEYKLIRRGEDYFKKDFTFPCIVKPNNLGSSLGISIVKNFIELEKAIAMCFRIDSEVIVEKYLDGCREYNISVLNNEGKVEVSEIEEVCKEAMFTYEDKYLAGGKKSGLASKDRIKKSKKNISVDIKREIEETAQIIYKQFKASGVIRIDFLYKDKLYVNEINSIPGSYAYYLWNFKYDFLELLDIVLKEAKRDNFFLSKPNELINKNVIFNL